MEKKKVRNPVARELVTSGLFKGKKEASYKYRLNKQNESEAAAELDNYKKNYDDKDEIQE